MFPCYSLHTTHPLHLTWSPRPQTSSALGSNLQFLWQQFHTGALLSLGHRNIHGDLKAKASFPSCPKFSVFAVGSSKGSGDWRCPIPSPARIYSGGGWGAFSNIPEVTGSRGGKNPSGKWKDPAESVLPAWDVRGEKVPTLIRGAFEYLHSEQTQRGSGEPRGICSQKLANLQLNRPIISHSPGESQAELI